MDEERENEELDLATFLKTDLCDEAGKESYPKKAAEIIYEIGKIYRKQSPDKISLIKSVGLFNAAIVRNPINLQQIKTDVSETCQCILKEAKASNQNADLIKKGNQIKQSINDFRNEVNQLLFTDDRSANNEKQLEAKAKNRVHCVSQKISLIQRINQMIALKYKQIMADLGQFCENTLGTAPCDYAIAGMGSLARTEITPYSDFEHVILLFDDRNYESYLEYFRWYSVIFHTVILNLQETIIPSLNIKTFNDKNFVLGDWYYDACTPRGISFDGMMPHASKFPLGRVQHTENKPFETELIKPVSEMLKYLSSDADLKNGYHLADILTKTCFVFGNEDVFKQFETGVQRYLNETTKRKRIEQVIQQVKDDLDNYCTRFRLANLKSNSTINIKRLIYRSTTIFIAALGRIHNISANSSFEIVNEMEKHNKISKNTRDELCYAIAIACEIRLKVYSKNNSQNDSPIDLKQKQQIINHVLDIVGASSTIKYFQIAYCLQCEVAKELNFTKLHFYSDPQMFNFKLGVVFEIDKLKAKFLKHRPNYVWNRNEFIFDKCIKELAIPEDVECDFNTTDNTKLLKKLANYLRSTGIYDEALEFYQQTLEIDQNKSTDEKKDGNIAESLHSIGECLRHMQQYDDALTHFNQSLEIKLNISHDQEKDGSIATTLDCIGSCLRQMQQYDNALTHLKRSLEIDRNKSHDEHKDGNIATRLNNIGLCLKEMQQYEEALTYYKQSLEINQNILLDERKNIATRQNNIGVCLMKMHKLDEALNHLKQALEINQNISHNKSKDISIATRLNNIGFCLMEMQKYNDALIYFKQSLEIAQNISLDERKDSNICTRLRKLGICLMKMQQYEDAFTHLNQSLDIKRNILRDQSKDDKIPETLDAIGLYLRQMQQCDHDVNHSKQLLEIINRIISHDEQKDSDIAETLDAICLCLRQLQQYEDAYTESVAHDGNMSVTQGPSFAERVRGSSQISRPNCLNFKTKSNLRRYEVIEFLQKMNFSKSKLVGVGEMKGRSIDITCKTRHNVLELYELLKEVDFIYNLNLYETENINVLVGWVPIPMTNEVIQKNIEMNYGKVLKIVDKNHKDGLKSSIRIITMKKCEIEMKPIPSYVKIEGCELYVTYSGQQITRKYCGNKGHVQSNCQKRLQDFPNLTSDQNNGNIFESASIENFEISADNIKLPKKRKLASDLNDSQSNFQVAKLCAEERSGDQTLNKPKIHHNTEPQVTVEILSSLSDGENISTNEIDSNVQQKEWWQETTESFQNTFY